MSREPEALAVAARYARRTDSGRYSMLRPEVWQTVHERQRAMLGLFTQAGLQDLSRLRLLEVGCGAGGNLLELLRLGFAPQHLGGIELLSERLKPGGAVLWYDFTVDNPRNPDVRGVPLARLRALFPQGRLRHRRVTLAPPLARAVVRVHPALYRAANALPWLRTHVLAWIAKP